LLFIKDDDKEIGGFMKRNTHEKSGSKRERDEYFSMFEEFYAAIFLRLLLLFQMRLCFVTTEEKISFVSMMKISS